MEICILARGWRLARQSIEWELERDNTDGMSCGGGETSDIPNQMLSDEASVTPMVSMEAFLFFRPFLILASLLQQS